jgi:hypothetical protein
MRVPMSQKLRFQILERDGFKCQYCGATAANAELQVDHIRPVARGGGNEETNLVTACRWCNSGKRARELRNKPPAIHEATVREAARRPARAVMRELFNRPGAWLRAEAEEALSLVGEFGLESVLREARVVGDRYPGGALWREERFAALRDSLRCGGGLQ